MQKRVEENKILFLLFFCQIFCSEKVTFENHAGFYLIYVYEV